MNIWQFQDLLSRRLLRWASISIGAGILFSLGSTFARRMGSQFVGWGLVNALIALWGEASMRRRLDQVENPGADDVLAKEEANLQRLLWINAGLDVLYVFGGFLWMKRHRGDHQAKGTGWGVVIQGVALFLFDLVHALRLPSKR